MRDRLDVFIHALEHFALMNQPADFLSAVQYAKGQVEVADEEDEKACANAIDAISDNYGMGD